MYLKRLDLQGFKSFPEKVKLEFNKGITTVVGPNGSGKSNISDSVRWVLGEQRAKSLRGDKMEDVIFAGTANRKALGFAEVSLTLDNEDHKMPLDYSEITVTRTVYRSGESKYTINGITCRLKDIHELFMDTGVGKEGYSIIGQGRIDEILSSKGEDRRRLFEEAAGIVKFRNRRFEAIAKLEKEHQNLIRVEDIINELELKLEPLEKQSEVAKKYLTLKEQLKKYEICNFYIQADKLEKEIAQMEQNKKISTGNIEDEKNAYEAENEEIKKLKESEEKLLGEIEKLNSDISNLATELEKNDGEIKLCTEQIQNIEINIKRIEVGTGDKQKKIEDFKNEKSIYSSKLMAIDVSLSSISVRLADKEEEFNKLSSTLAQSEEQIEDYKADMLEKIKMTTDLKSNIQRLQLMNQQFQQRHDQISHEGDYIQSQIHHAQTRVEALIKLIEQKQSEIGCLESRRISLEETKKIIEGEISENKKVYQQKISRLNECKSKFKVLSEMKNDYDGFFKSVKSILKLRGTHGFMGICGAVGELISVEQKYETAIEIAIGGALQNVVTENEQDAKIAIEYLKKNFLGRSTFLPLSVIKGKDLGNDKEEVLKAQGVLGIAKNLVGYNSKYENVMSSLLGRVVIMENMDFALKLAAKTRHMYKLVTLDGDVLNPGGTMTGGSVAKKTSNIFSRSREIVDLEEEIKVLEKSSKNLFDKINLSQEKVEEINKEKAEIGNSLQEIHILVASMEQEKLQNENGIVEKKQRHENSKLESSALMVQISTANSDVADFSEKLKVAEDEIDEINKALENYHDTIQSDKTVRDSILNSITEYKVSLSASQQEKNAVMENLRRVKMEEKSLGEEIYRLAIEKDEFFSTRVLKESAIEEVKSKININKEKQQSFEAFRNELSQKVHNIKEETLKAEIERQQHFETINQLKNDVFKMETRLEHLNAEKDRIYSDVWEEYEVTYQQAKAMNDDHISATELSGVTKQLKVEIKALGAVNVNAIEEYKIINERYIFLTTQRNDIINAEDKLQKIITELAIMMQEQFKEQFKLISENFNIVFREMFGGGKAYLKMVDESNVLESGIEIIAQPPGKNLQNMMLLSGGERALTAIAILFAILKMKPSPFCILDEIEAALDDANVKRFANYLGEFSDGTQFIVITHRKGTMEVADVMYGVTMQEQGVSKVISVKFDEANL
ncbi:MAG TPA: chromosome segregation protein SMC [Lachnospiraceae bacterium]|nr:chromosome segregation protein SMC [Lachnospiraceae bacterium]